MKLQHGYWLPDSEQHFQQFLAAGGYQTTHRQLGLDICSAVIGKFRTAIDIGANIGLWARPLSDLFAKTICFEPMKSNFECLHKNMEEKTAELHNCALSDTTGKLTLHEPVDMSNCGSPSLLPLGEGDLLHQVDVHTLDDWQYAEVDFMKIDVQGWEMKVLTGARRTLLDNKVALVCENHPRRDHIETLLAEFDYRKVASYLKEDYYCPASELTRDARERLNRLSYKYQLFIG